MRHSIRLQIRPRRGTFRSAVRRLTIHVVLLGALLGLAASAQAGTMTLYSCHDPVGRPLTGAGWVAEGTGSLRDECARQPNGALIAELPGSAPGGWTLTAAPGTAFGSFSAQACMNSGPFGFTWFYS